MQKLICSSTKDSLKLCKNPFLIPTTTKFNGNKFNPNFDKLHKLLQNPVGRTQPKEHPTSFPITVDSAWSYYRCSAHVNPNNIPRPIFFVLFQFVFDVCSTPATAIDYLNSIFNDMRMAGHNITETEAKLIVKTLGKCNILGEKNLFELLNLPTTINASKLFGVLTSKYSELGNANGIIDVLESAIKRNILDQSLKKQIVASSLSRTFSIDSQLVVRILTTMLANNHPLHVENIIDLLEYLRELPKGDIASAIARIIIHGFVVNQYQNSMHFTLILEELKRLSLYVEADLIWRYGSKISHSRKRKSQISLHSNTILLYCSILMLQKRQIESVSVFWKFLVKLPNKIRKNGVLHQEFLNLCLKYECIDSYQIHISAMSDANIRLD